MSKTIVRIFSHNFTVANITEQLKPVITKFSGWFDEYEWLEQQGAWEKQWKGSYAMPSADCDTRRLKNVEYRFHINTLPEFKNLLIRFQIDPKTIEYVIEPEYETTPITIEMKPSFKPFDEQVPIYDQLILGNPVSKLLGLQTGGGKSALSIFAAAHWKMMTVCIMKPGYIDKWVGDWKKQTLLEFSEIETVSGLSNLAELIRGIENGFIKPKVVLISNATFRNWISEQEKLPPGEMVSGFPCEPWEFMQYCGFGFRIIDEVHQDFHANFRIDLNTHIAQSLALSATLITKNEYKAKMYKIAYPDANRMAVPEYVKFIRSISWMYDFANPRILRTNARGRTSYSHVEFEKSIMHSVKLMKQYLLMVYDVMRKTYMFERKDGDRCVVYFSTKKMCEQAKFYFAQMLPHLKVTKFNEGDPLSNILEADLCFATLTKAGTAIDIPMLTTVIMTIAVDSIQANLQALGRLRNLKKLYGSDRIPTFVYFACMNIDKQMNYHRSKQDLLKQKAMITTSMQHNVPLGY